MEQIRILKFIKSHHIIHELMRLIMNRKCTITKACDISELMQVRFIMRT